MECIQRSSFVSILRPRDQQPAVLLSLTVGYTGKLLTGYLDGVVKVWTHTEEEEHGIRQVSMFPALSPRGITALCLGPRNMSAASGDLCGSIKLLDLETNQVFLGTSMQRPICSLGFKKEADSFLLLCASNTNIFLWDIRQKVSKCLELSIKKNRLTIAATGSAEFVAAGCTDGKILLWDIRTAGCVDKVLTRHYSRVTSLEFASSGNELAGGFQDGNLAVWDITQTEDQVSRSELVAISPVTSLAFSRNSTKLFAGAMGSISRLDIADIHEPVEKIKLDDWKSSAVKDMSQLGDTDKMMLVCAQPILRSKIVSVNNPMDILIDKSMVADEEKSKTCMDNNDTCNVNSIKKEISGIVGDEEILIAEKPLTSRENVVTINTKASISIENSGTLEESSIDEDMSEFDKILFKENVITNSEDVATNTDIRYGNFIENSATLDENFLEEEMTGTNYENILSTEETFNTNTENSPTKQDNMKKQSLVTPEKYSITSNNNFKNKTNVIKEDLEENIGQVHELNDKYILKEGMTFKCKNDAIFFMKEYCHEHKTAFVLKSSQSKTGAGLLYSCKHGLKRRSESRGKRVIQRSVKKNCPAFIRFYVRKSGRTVLKGFDVKHENHYVNENIYMQDVAKADDKALKIIKQMMDGNCKVGNIKRALASNDIFLSSDQVRYQVKQILGKPMLEEKLTEFVKLVKHEGGSVEILRFPDGKIRIFTVTTLKMKKAFLGSNPTVIQVDTTFGFERSGYKLNAILYCNPSTGKGEIVQLAFMADETGDSYNFVISKFKEIVYCDPTVILIDKVMCAIFFIL